MMKLPALILAGGEVEGKLKAVGSPSSKGFLKLEGRFMVEYVIDVLRKSSFISEIIMASPEGIIPPEVPVKIDKVARSGSTIIDSLSNGLEAIGDTKRVLVVPCDLVLLNWYVLEDFLVNCEKRNLDLGYSFVPKNAHTKEYAKIRHTYIHLKEGRFCGGGLIYLKPSVVYAFKDLFEEIVALRKKPWLISKILGLKFIFKFIIRQLTIREVEDKISEILSVKAGGIMLKHPGAAANIDKLEDFYTISEILKTRTDYY